MSRPWIEERIIPCALKLYSISGCEPELSKGNTTDIYEKHQQGSPSMEEIILTNIPVSQSQNGGEVDGKGTTAFRADGHKNRIVLGLENLYFAEQPVKTNSKV